MKLFGTDGIRGPVGSAILSPDLLLKVAYAAKKIIAPNGGKVIIGKDTRVSGYVYESLLEAGFLTAGMDVYLTGPLTTPALSYYTHHYNFDIGCMISASHNSYHDNGIKFFDRNGDKLDSIIEGKIEGAAEEVFKPLTADQIGKAKRLPLGINDYLTFCVSKFNKNFLDGFKVVFDASNGGGFKLGPRILSELGADVLPLGASPNGYNINDRCGSTDTQLVSKLIQSANYDIGISIDGDGDRVILIDELGNTVDGDQIIFILAKHLKIKKCLDGPVAITVHSNQGLRQALESLNIDTIITNIGDKYVTSALKKAGGHLGGEASGHIINTKYNNTGDGILAALQVLEVMKDTGKKLNELLNEYSPVPSINSNYKLAADSPVLYSDLEKFSKKWSLELGKMGRVLARKSGTEPLLRLLIESSEPELFEDIENDFKKKFKSFLR